MKKIEEMNSKYADHDQSKKTIEQYLLRDGEVEPVDKISMFLDWCKKEGVVMPKCEYPAYFKNGLIGVRCKEDIKNREAYCFIPYKMVITAEKVQNNTVLKPLLEAYSDIFDAEVKGIGW